MHLELVDPRSAGAESIWRALADRPPRSYFLSWGWVHTWLACLPPEELPQLAVIREAAAPRAAFFLTRRTIRRHRVIPSRALYFNTTGIERFDELLIEYNGLVGVDLGIAELAALLPAGWDELFLPAIRADAFGGLTAGELPGAKVRIDRKVPVYTVDLDHVRAEDYLAQLSSQTRTQVRRALREAGPTTVDVARTPREALALYAELCDLHGRQWRARGEPGAFTDPWFDLFHRRLIATRFEHGEIQLLRVRNGAGTIGVLYNFVFDGRVLQYQSGLEQFENKHLKPGFVTHTAAIDHAAAAGHAVYDFLAGDMRYKKSLSTDCGWLYWARVQRHALRFVIEDRLRAWVHARRVAGAGS